MEGKKLEIVVGKAHPSGIRDIEGALEALVLDPDSKRAVDFVTDDLEKSGEVFNSQILHETCYSRATIEMWLTFANTELNHSQKQAALLIVAAKLIQQLKTSENALLGEALHFCRDKLQELNWKNMWFIDGAISKFSDEFREKVERTIHVTDRYQNPKNSFPGK